MTLKSMTILWAGLLTTQVYAADAPVLKTNMEMVSYGLGVDMARNIKKQKLEVNPELLQKGLKDGLSGEKLLMPEKELRNVMNELKNDLRKKMVLNRRIEAGENKTKGAEFLAANMTREGVVTLPSGVQYKILKAGDGRKPKETDMVECHYRGTLIDGTEFDGTEAGKPATLKVAQLIPGWKEALKLMPAGSRWQIVIPSQSAYGERGTGSEIGPNETLIFEVELVAVK